MLLRYFLPHKNRESYCLCSCHVVCCPAPPIPLSHWPLVSPCKASIACAQRGPFDESVTVNVINCDMTFSKSSALLSDSDSHRSTSWCRHLLSGYTMLASESWLLLTVVICPNYLEPLKYSAFSPFYLNLKKKTTATDLLKGYRDLFPSVEVDPTNPGIWLTPQRLWLVQIALDYHEATQLPVLKGCVSSRWWVQSPSQGSVSFGSESADTLPLKHEPLWRWAKLCRTTGSKFTTTAAPTPLAGGQVNGKVCSVGQCVWRTKIERERKKCSENKWSHWSAINIQINTLFVGFVIHRKHEVLPQTANLWCLMGSVSHMLPLSAYETLATGTNRRKVFRQLRFVMLNIT